MERAGFRDEQFDRTLALAHRDHAALKEALGRGIEPEDGVDISQFVAASVGLQ